MKTIRFFIMAALIPMLASCLNDDSGSAGFGSMSGFSGYANNTKGYVSFAALGDWTLTQRTGADWCKVERMSGKGNYYYTIPTTFEVNRTGKIRYAEFHLEDDNESKAYVDFSLFQTATRGDGSLGSAPLVKTITGDDGTDISIAYDGNDLPTDILVKKDGATLHDLAFSYNEKDTTITVRSSGGYISGKYVLGYQLTELKSENDTIALGQDIFYNSVAIGITHSRRGGEVSGMSQLYLKGQRFGADDEHSADSLKYYHRYADGRDTYTEALELKMSETSNRNQSVDVNQLILGVSECNPYMLVPFFRNMRNSFIISEAKGADGKYTVATELNADKSVATMTVTDKKGRAVKYTFEY